jgi:long-chain acyl-CoA synthetase
LTLDEWTPESGLVTAAFKIRRREVVEKYRREIDEMYHSK